MIENPPLRLDEDALPHLPPVRLAGLATSDQELSELQELRTLQAWVCYLKRHSVPSRTAPNIY